MKKPTATFRLSKTAKRIGALMSGSKDQRDHFKRMMIDAQLSAAFIPPQEKKNK